jgi:translation initiation factor IF-2
MPKTKISKLAKDLNVALPTVFEFLRSKEISIEESPNTRVEDSIAELINNEFNDDRILKNRSEQATEDRLKNRGKNNNTQKSESTEIKTASENMQKPKIVGKIDLDNNGNPVKTEQKIDAPAAEPAKPAQQPVEQPKQQHKDNNAHDRQQKGNNNNAQQQHQNQQKKQGGEQRNQHKANDNNKKQKADNHKPHTEAKPAAEKTEAAVDSNFIETKTPKGPSLNIIGKIDLDSLNQSTRPKKKSKEDRRNERRQQAEKNGNGGGDRKKRKRIGGNTKVDIEKAGAQAAENNNGGGKKGGNGGGGNNGGGNSRREKQRPPKRPVHQEVNEEDVSKQVKETLARLTAKDKNLKKGAKWRKEKREANAEARAEAAAEARAESRVLKLTEFVTANDLALMMDVPINNVIATCMNIGVMVSINQRLDAETINIVAEEFGFKTEYVSAEVADAISQEEDSEEDLQPRSPIVTVMGHVDHGKTSLLDYIRNANVIAGEAGGITQHIGAYNVKLEDGRHITFLDTPGHEAFTAMRARGAKVTDLCIIIVAADDSVMPQTVEAINHAAAAGVPIVFAINKIDKPHANPDKIKEELAAMNYLVEEWGGKYQSQDISAKKGIGVEELMEKVLLEAEMLDLKANPNRNAVGSIIESSLDKGRGYVATVLVQNGTLRQGDIILAGNHYGKIKAMFNERNQRITEAGPATPALILGLNGAPTAGDTFNVLDSEQEAREIANKREQLQREQGLRTTKILTLDDIARRRAIGNFQELNIIVKGDVDGSIEALSDSLIKLSTEEIQVNVLHKAVGEISESDVTLAAASNAVIIGFQVRPSQAARRAAERDGVEIRLYSVIYQAIEEVKDAMSGMLAPEIKEEIIGTTEVMETYRISKVGTIAGGMVREGKMKRGCKVRLIRDGIVRYTGDLGSLKRFKDDVKEVASGYDCGLSIAGYNDIQVGDMIEAFEEVEVNRSL